VTRVGLARITREGLLTRLFRHDLDAMPSTATVTATATATNTLTQP
jgi:hypothetical protein